MKSLMYIIISSLLLLPSAALAEQATYSGPCVNDIAKHCEQIQPGGGRVNACLKAKEAHLSVECKDELKSMQWRIRRAPDECAGDVVLFCANVRAVDRRIVRCLLQNEKDLSNECRKRLNAGDADDQD